MKNRILAFIMTAILISGLNCFSIFASGMTFYPESGSYVFDESQIGEKFIVDFLISGNEGFNNATFRVKYDPSVIVAVPNETSDSENDGFIVYEVDTGKSRRIFFNSAIETQLNLVPQSGAGDYEGRADGKKTAAETGILVFGQYVSSVVGPFNTYDDGIYIRLTFEIMGPGETNIEILPKQGSNCIFYATKPSAKVDVSFEDAYVKVNGGEQAVETTTESSKTSSESSTETTTKSSSSSSTSSSGSSGSKSSSSSSSESSSSNAEETEDSEDSDGKTESDDSIDLAEDAETASPAFSDTSNYPWAEGAINYLAQKGIVKGVEEGKFAPQNNVKRADFLIMLMNALEISAKSGDSGFLDVDSSKYYADAVSAAKSIGIAAGDDKGNFRPEEFISRQDMMVLAYRALNASEHSVTADSSDALQKFTDEATVSEYAKEALNAMVYNKIVNGTGEKIEPKANTTRAQAAVIVYNILNFIE